MRKRFTPPSRQRRHRHLLAGLVMLLAGAIAAFAVTDSALLPALSSYAEAEAKIYANRIINETVNKVLKEENVTYDELIVQTLLSDGIVSMVKADSVKLNLIKTRVINEIQAAAAEINQTKIEIPFGNLTGSAYMIGKGPSVSVKLKMADNTVANFSSEFLSGGINQTQHLLMLDVKATVYLVMPGNKSVELDTNFILGETIIVGKVPDAYTNVFQQGISADEDISGEIMDYGATQFLSP